MNKQFCMERSFLLRVLTVIMQAIIIHVHVPTLLGLVNIRSERVNKVH